MRTGVRLAIDLGSARVGVARCDPDGLLASPLATVARGRSDLDALAALATEHGAIEVIVGLPTGLSGRAGTAAATARTFAESLATRLAPLPVRLVDERFTTVLAHDALRQGGRGSRQRRGQVDKAAAALGGGGGGRDDVAQGGGAPLGDRGSTALDEAFSVVRAVVTDIAGHGGVA